MRRILKTIKGIIADKLLEVAMNLYEGEEQIRFCKFILKFYEKETK